MATRELHSLRFEYDEYVQREIEDYKDSIPRSVILSIGDEAVANLRAREQLEIDEMVLWAEVDSIIRKRLRIPEFSAWKRRRLRKLEKYRSAKNLGFPDDAQLVREIPAGSDAHVLVAGRDVERPALYFAAHGCQVTALENEADMVDRVMTTAVEVGLSARVNGCVSTLDNWAPDGPLAAVVCTSQAFDGLSDADRSRVLKLLQGATRDGGVHLVRTIVAGQTAVSLRELRSMYRGWEISVEHDPEAGQTFYARKSLPS